MKKSFGKKLKALRGARSQASVAAVFGIDQQTYGGWEKDQRKPDLSELGAICTHYSVTADWLLGLAEESAANLGHPPSSPAPRKINLPAPLDIQRPAMLESPPAERGEFPPEAKKQAKASRQGTA